MLEVDWEKLGEDNSSVFDMYTGLKLDERQVKAGRENAMLEFEVCEEVSEELARGKRIWNSAWLDLQKKVGLDWWSIKSEVHANAKTCLRPHHHLQKGVPFLSSYVSWSWPLLWLVGCVCGNLPCYY